MIRNPTGLASLVGTLWLVAIFGLSASAVVSEFAGCYPAGFGSEITAQNLIRTCLVASLLLPIGLWLRSLGDGNRTLTRLLVASVLAATWGTLGATYCISRLSSPPAGYEHW